MTILKSGMVAVVGAANVGKSTLVNALVGEKVTIVSPVVQTTRNVVRAILTEPRGQLVFMDTPGVHKAQYDLGRLMNRMARQTAVGADAVLLVLDAARPPREEDEGWMRRLLRPDADGGLLIALNKTDLERNHTTEYQSLWTTIAHEKGMERSPIWHPLSALRQKGISELTEYLFSLMSAGPYLFPADVLTDYPKKLNIADVIREKYVVRLKDELPHAIAVWIEDIAETGERWTVNGAVYVNRHSQKGIVLGAKGRLLKSVCHEAGQDLSEMYERPVTVKLWVKCEPDWSRNFWMLRKLGYA